MIQHIKQNKFSGHGAGSCPAFPNRTPTTDLDHVAGCPRWSLLIIFDIIDSYYDDDDDDDPNHVANCPRSPLLLIVNI